jgi:hypothetical protein
VCLGCYAIYFELAGQARFVAGLVPYGAVALSMTAVGAMLVRALRARGGGLPE